MRRQSIEQTILCVMLYMYMCITSAGAESEHWAHPSKLAHTARWLSDTVSMCTCTINMQDGRFQVFHIFFIGNPEKQIELATPQHVCRPTEQAMRQSSRSVEWARESNEAVDRMLKLPEHIAGLL